MVTKVQGWKVHPSPYRDEELIRFVTSDPTVTALERDLALRLDKLLYRCDQIEADMEDCVENAPTQLALF
jgi:hypothetical protein